MAQKTIIQLQETLSLPLNGVIPVDDGIQTYRITVSNFVKSLHRAAFGVWHAIVGSADYCTHATLSAALADSNVLAGSRIIILESDSLSSPVTIAKDNLLIEGAPGVTLTDSGASTGLVINAIGIRIRSLKFSDFSSAIQINDGNNYNFITECRFNNCSVDVEDQNSAANNLIFGNITE